jgi:oligopeptide/dipeptide ABC transporter ATP-binding protein
MTIADAPLLQVSGLTKHFASRRGFVAMARRQSRGLLRALREVSFDVRRGETLGIVGESGCGKSTLARCLVRLHEPSEGSIRFDGQDVLKLRGDERRRYHRRVQMAFQDPYGSLNPRLTVGQALAEAVRFHDLRSPAQTAARVSELLDLVGLPPSAARRYPREFSGGQRQRIGIARALAVEPEVLIADEIVSALDVSVQAQIINLLLELQNRLRLTILFIAHDLRIVRHLSHRVAVMYLGSIVEIGETESLFTAPAHPYTAALLAAAPEIDWSRRDTHEAVRGELPSPFDMPSGCAFRTRCRYATELCAREGPLLTPNAAGGLVACHHRLT